MSKFENMTDTDSLYTTSVSPRPTFKFPRLSNSDRCQDQPEESRSLITVQQSPGVSRDQERKEEGRGASKAFKPYTAPMPRMSITSSKASRDEAALVSPTNEIQSNARTFAPCSTSQDQRREITPLEAAAKRANDARDDEDSDFEHNLFGAQVNTSQKKRKAPAEEPSSKPVKKARDRKSAYSSRTSQTQKGRVKHLSRIEENWKSLPDERMPELFSPSKNSNSGKGKEQVRNVNLKDLSASVLEELAYLSSVTRDDYAKGYEALQNAVRRGDRAHSRRQLEAADVQYAIDLLNAITDESTKDQAALDLLEVTAAGQDVVPTEETTEERLADENYEHGTSSQALRSATLAPEDFRDAQETVGDADAHDQIACRAADGVDKNDWAAYDDDLEMLADLEAEEKAARAVHAVLVERRVVRERIRQRNSEKAVAKPSALKKVLEQPGL